MRACACVCVRLAETHSAGDWEKDEGRNREIHKQIVKKEKETLRVR